MIDDVIQYLTNLQNRICAALEEEDGQAEFAEDAWSRDGGSRLGGGGRTRVLEKGAVFEQAGVNFSHVTGASLPPTATAARANTGTNSRCPPEVPPCPPGCCTE